jgi:hypothetical protein
LKPAPNHRIEHPREILDLLVTAQRQIPAPNLCTNGIDRFVRNGWTEVDEVLTLAILRSARPKSIAEKIEFFVWVTPSPEIILAIDNLRLFRMKFQSAFL